MLTLLVAVGRSSSFHILRYKSCLTWPGQLTLFSFFARRNEWFAAGWKILHVLAQLNSAVFGPALRVWLEHDPNKKRVVLPCLSAGKDDLVSLLLISPGLRILIWSDVTLKYKLDAKRFSALAKWALMPWSCSINWSICCSLTVWQPVGLRGWWRLITCAINRLKTQVVIG